MKILTTILYLSLSLSAYAQGSAMISTFGGGTDSNTVYSMIQTYAPTNGGITGAQAGAIILTTNTTDIIPRIGTAQNNASNGVIGLFGTYTNLVAFTNGAPPVVGQALVITGTNAQGVIFMKGTNWPSGGGSSIPSVLGIVTNTAGGVIGVSTAVPGTWIGAASLPVSAADTSWMPVTNAIASTNASKATVLARQPALSTGGTNGNGALTIIFTNLMATDLEYHVATNAFTNVVVGYIGPLTNYDGLRFYIPIGTNMP